MKNDDLERRLDDLYRSLDASARRVEARWKTRPATRRRTADSSHPLAAWLGAAVAAAAAVLLVVLALRSEKRVPIDVVQVPAPQATPEPRRTPPPPPVPVVAPRPTPEPTPAPLQPPPPPPPSPVVPAPEPPKPPVPPPPVPPPPPPPVEAPAPTRVVRASVLLQELDGTFDLADKALRGKQKDVTVSAGDRLRAASGVVRLTLAEDRIVLLAPRSVVEFRPEEKRLALLLEQGELLADLVGSGPEIKVVTRACEVTPIGTVFAVKVVPGKAIVTVEKGRVEVQSPKGKSALRAAESIQAADDGTLGANAPADFRTLAWARGQRPAELTLYSEDFSKAGAWEGEIDKGVARAVPKPGSAPVLHVAGDRLFEVPVRGTLTLVCRSDRTSKLKIQVYAGDVRTTYRIDVPLLRTSDWRTLTFSMDDFVPSDRTKATGRPAPGAPITDLLLMAGDDEDRGNFWVDSIRVTELR